MKEDEMWRIRALDRKGRARFVKSGKPGTWVMLFNGRDCAFLDPVSKLCTIYEKRPRGCQQFPIKPYVGCLVWPGKESDAAFG